MRVKEKQMLKGNYKIDVSALSTVERTRLQEELFKMGYWWDDDTRHVINLDEEYLCLFEDMTITYCDKDYFARSLFTPLTPSDILHQPMETITLRDYFAGLAMVQLMQVHDANVVADWAYHFADMMLKERNK